MFGLRSFAGVALLGCLLLCGCGDGRPKRVPVSGVVLIDGKPLTRGQVQLAPAKDRPAYGDIGPDGRFTLTTFTAGDGCVPGKHKVAVNALEILNAGSQKRLVPVKYSQPETSGVEVDVTGPTTNLEIKLTWEGGQPVVENFGAGDTPP